MLESNSLAMFQIYLLAEKFPDNFLIDKPASSTYNLMPK